MVSRHPARVDLSCRRAAASSPRGARRERLARCLGRRARHDVRPVECRRRVRGPWPARDVHRARRGRPARRAHDLGGDRHGHGRRRAVHAVTPHRHHRRPGARPHRRPGRQRLRLDGGGAPALPRQPRRTSVGRGRLPRDGCAGGRATGRCIRSRARRRGTSRRRRPTERRSGSSSTSAHRGRASRARGSASS